MSNRTLNRMLDDFYPYAKDYLGFDKDAKISFASDKNNANKPLGKTAYYDPSNHSVTVYTDNRHPKDIMRSVSHELVHHAQNCRGDLSMSEDTGAGYAQNDEHLREMEREAYEKGNLCFRDWEDGVKSNIEPGTIYESTARRSKKSMNNFKTLSENFKKFLKEDWQDDPMGGMSGGDSEQYETLVRDTIEDILEMEGTSIQAIQSPMQLARLVGQVMQQSGVEESGLDEDDIMSLIGDMQQGTMQESGGTDWEAHEKMKAQIADMLKTGHASVDDILAGLQDIHGWSEQDMGAAEGALEDMVGDGILSVDDIGMYALSTMGKPMREGSSEPKEGDDVKIIGGALTGAEGEVMELTTTTQGSPAVVVYLRKDADMKVYGKAGDEVIVQPKFVEVDRGIQGDDSVEPEDDYNWVGHKAHYQEGTDVTEEYNGHLWENKIDKIVDMVMKEYGDHETQAQGGMVSSSHSSDPELDQIADIVRTVIEQGGGLHDLKKPLEAEAFDVSATSQFIIVTTTSGDVGIASAKNVELAGDEELIDTPYGQLAVGRINQGMEEGMSGGFDVSQIQSREDKKYGGMIHMLPDIQFTGDIATDMQSAPSELLSWLYGELESGDSVQDSAGRVYAGSDVQDVVKDMPDEMFAEGFRGSPEEKEMTSKMSNKEFSDYHTRDKHLTPDLKGDMGPIDGMEGPFQYASGAVLYYDSKAGKYYDRGSDRYLDNEEAAKLTMENNQMKLKNNLREKVKTSVMSKLKEMYDDDDPYADEDPYMSGLEAEFPWLADKKGKGGAQSPADAAAAEAAAAADAAAAGEFEIAPEEEEEDPTVMKEASFSEYGRIDAEDGNPPSKIGQGDPAYMEAYNAVLVARGEEPLPIVKPDQAYLDALQSGSMKPEDHSYNMEENDARFATSLRDRVTKRLQELSKGQEEMDLDDDGKIEPEDLAGLRSGKEDEDVGEEAEEKNESLRDKVYRIVQETLNESDDEEEEGKEEVEEGKDKNEDDDGFIYATDKKTAETDKNASDARNAYKPKNKDEDDEEKNEGKYKREDDEKEEVEEGKYKREDDKDDEDNKEEQNESEEAEGEDPEADEDKEEVEENIAANPEDFFRKLRNESRKVAKQKDWNDSHRSKRSSMLNERLMKSWFNK